MTIAECQVETIKHIETVRKYIKFVCDALMVRAIKHDATSLNLHSLHMEVKSTMNSFVK